MEKQFNTIIIDTMVSFIQEHKLLGDKPSLGFSNNQNKYVFGSQNYGNSLDSVYKDIRQFDIFAPISSFNYNSNNYLIQFKDEFNHKIFSIFLNKFLNPMYEDLFYSTITKVIPINFCVQNQPWNIVKKFLSTKPRKSNGLPSIINMKEFFQHLLEHIQEADFQECLFKFCQYNTSFIKRVEAQEYLKNLISYLDNSDKFSVFFKEITQTLTIEKTDFVTFYINKKMLFNHFSNIAIDKKQPVMILSNIFSAITANIPDYTKIEQVFIEQKDERFSELLILVRFSEKIDYSFESYYLYLLKFFLTNQFELKKNLHTVSRHFFLNLKHPEKTSNIKQKTAKI